MPIIKSAKKKLRADKKRRTLNKKLAIILSSSIKKAKKLPSDENVRKAISVADKAAKKNIIHKNKAARLKSKLSKLLALKSSKAQKNKERKREQKKSNK